MKSIIDSNPGGARNRCVLTRGVVLRFRSRTFVVTTFLITAIFLVSAGGVQEHSQENTENFDMLVREDFFAGFAGDAQALKRGMKRCAEALAKDPRNAQALVWHGSGMTFEAKEAFLAGDPDKGHQIQAQAIKEMNDAVALRPDDVSVLIPRAAVFLSAALHVPSPEVANRDFQRAASDYERILHLQTSTFATLPMHSRGELLGGLAEAWQGLGDPEKSRSYLLRMKKELPNTAYSRHASEILAAPPKGGSLGTTCLGCHVGRTRG